MPRGPYACCSCTRSPRTVPSSCNKSHMLRCCNRWEPLGNRSCRICVLENRGAGTVNQSSNSTADNLGEQRQREDGAALSDESSPGNELGQPLATVPEKHLQLPDGGTMLNRKTNQKPRTSCRLDLLTAQEKEALGGPTFLCGSRECNPSPHVSNQKLKNLSPWEAQHHLL